MTGDTTDKDIIEDVETTDDTEENIVLDAPDVDFGDTVVEANVDELVAKIDETDVEEAARKRRARKRLEELREQQSVDLDSTFNFNIDEELK